MNGKPIVPATTFSSDPRDGVYLTETLLMGGNPKLHAVTVELPHSYLLIVPTNEMLADGKKAMRLQFYDMAGPPLKSHERLPGVDYDE